MGGCDCCLCSQQSSECVVMVLLWFLAFLGISRGFFFAIRYSLIFNYGLIIISVCMCGCGGNIYLEL